MKQAAKRTQNFVTRPEKILTGKGKEKAEGSIGAITKVHSFPSNRPLIFHFPSEKTILAYLEHHPHTGKEEHSYLSEKNIIQTIAKFFANQDKIAVKIVEDVVHTMNDLNEKFNWSEAQLKPILANLTTALLDLANGKKIQGFMNEES